MVDIHSHILFDIDDGAKDIATSLKMLEAEKKDGVTEIVATPHFDFATDDLSEFASKRRERINSLSKAFPDIKIYAGAEIVASPFIANAAGLDTLCIEGTRALLLEMPSEYFGAWVKNMVDSLVRLGYTPIFAHIERYPYLSSVKNLGILVKKGALTQVNSAILQNPSFFTKRFLKNAAKKGLIHFIGTDTHSDEWRKPNIKDGYFAAEELFGKGYAHKIRRNGENLLLHGKI